MRAIGPCALTALSLGCGNPACDALAQGTSNESAQGQPCGLKRLVITHDECPDWLWGCTRSDHEKMQAYGECLSQLPTCSPQTLEQWTAREYACGLKVSEVSQSCGS